MKNRIPYTRGLARFDKKSRKGEWFHSTFFVVPTKTNGLQRTIGCQTIELKLIAEENARKSVELGNLEKLESRVSGEGQNATIDWEGIPEPNAESVAKSMLRLLGDAGWSPDMQVELIRKVVTGDVPQDDDE